MAPADPELPRRFEVEWMPLRLNDDHNSDTGPTVRVEAMVPSTPLPRLAHSPAAAAAINLPPDTRLRGADPDDVFPEFTDPDRIGLAVSDPDATRHSVPGGLGYADPTAPPNSETAAGYDPFSGRDRVPQLNVIPPAARLEVEPRDPPDVKFDAAATNHVDLNVLSARIRASN